MSDEYGVEKNWGGKWEPLESGFRSVERAQSRMREMIGNNTTDYERKSYRITKITREEIAPRR